MSEEAIALLITLGVLAVLIVWNPCLSLLDRRTKAYANTSARERNRNSPSLASQHPDVAAENKEVMHYEGRSTGATS